MPIKRNKKWKLIFFIGLAALSFLSIWNGVKNKELQKIFINASSTCYSCIGLE